MVDGKKRTTLVGATAVLCLLPALSLCALETDALACVDMEVRTDRPILTHIPIPNTETCTLRPDTAGMTCDEIYKNGNTKSGVYKAELGIRVFCTMNHLGYGWTVIMRMVNASYNAFERSYQDYKDGFGSFEDNFFLGLESIHEMTKKGLHELYIGMELEEGSSFDYIFAGYANFSLGDMHSGYKLSVGKYMWKAPGNPSWNAGGDGLAHNHNGGTFSAEGSPQPYCGKKYGAWWYKSSKQACDNNLWSNFIRWSEADALFKLKTFVMAIRKY